MRAPFFSFSIQPYLPVVFAVFFNYLEFVWDVLLPHSPVEHAKFSPLLEAFPSPSTLGEVVPHQPCLSGLFIYSLCEEYPSPTLPWSMPHFSYCCKPSPLQAHWGICHHIHLFWPACLFKVHVRECPSLPLVEHATL
jgi:hypothetical protein